MKKSSKKKPVGRPKSDNPASVTIPRVRVTPSQLEIYKASSEREGKTFSAWVRDSLDSASVKNNGKGGGSADVNNYDQGGGTENKKSESQSQA